jgi:hypothetical protein
MGAPTTAQRHFDNPWARVLPLVSLLRPWRSPAEVRSWQGFAAVMYRGLTSAGGAVNSCDGHRGREMRERVGKETVTSTPLSIRGGNNNFQACDTSADRACLSKISYAPTHG